MFKYLRLFEDLRVYLWEAEGNIQNRIEFPVKVGDVAMGILKTECV